MVQTQSVERAPTVTTAAPAPTQAAASNSNQDRAAATGMATSAPPESGGDLFRTLPLLGDLAAVVLSAMPAAAALPLAVAYKHQPFVQEWLRALDGADLLALAKADAAALLNLLIEPGTTIEARLEAKVAIVLGVLAGSNWSFRYDNPHQAAVGYKGKIGGLATGGFGSAVAYEGGDRTGASGSVDGMAAVGIQIEWTLDPVAAIQNDLATIRALLAGTLPEPEVLEAQLRSVEPTTVIAELSGELSGELGAGAFHLEADTPADCVAAGVAEGAVNLVGALFSGAFLSMRGGAKIAGGFDGEGAFAAVELSRTAAASFVGLDGRNELGARIELREGDPAKARDGAAPIRGVLELFEANDEDRHTTRATWNGVVELENLQGKLAAPTPHPVMRDDDGPGELVVKREHRIQDPGLIRDLIEGTPLAATLLRFVVGHAELRYDAEVSVRMGEDCSPAFPGARPEGEEQARDQQRALAALVLGESFATEAPIYAARAQECASLEKATLTLVADVGAGLGGEVAAGAKVNASGAAGATYKREQDLTAELQLSDVARLLEA